MLVFHEQNDGRINVFQYMPSLDEYPIDNNLRRIRAIDLIQRLYIAGRLDHAFQAWENLEPELLRLKWYDPLAGCLGSYLLLRMGKSKKLGQASENMQKYYGQLCDSHIIRGEYLSSIGDKENAMQYFIRALDQGYPFCRGIASLN
jgi:hypothetical protein